MNEYGLESPRARQMLEAARAMGPALRERAAQCQAEGQIPDETIADFHEAGFFKVMQPEQWGGYAMDPQVFYAVGLELARHCMSSAWVLGVVAVHNWQLAIFDDRAAQDVWAQDPTTLISSSYAPVGKVKVVDGGFRLSGRWSFSSGSAHAEWAFLGAVVPTPSDHQYTSRVGHRGRHCPVNRRGHGQFCRGLVCERATQRHPAHPQYDR